MKATKKCLLTFAAMTVMTGAWAQAAEEEVPMTRTANANEWTLTMPNANVELEVTYATLYNLAKAAGSETYGWVTFVVDGETATQAYRDDVVTVSVTLAGDYAVTGVTVSVAGSQDTFAATKQQDGTWTFVMPEASVEVSVEYVYDPVYYAVSAVSPEHGSLSVGTTTAIEGETVGVSATADEGYYVESINVSGYNFDTTIGAEGGSFVMPGGPVTVTAVIREQQDLAAATVTLDWTAKTYSGEAQKPTVTGVSLGEATLAAGDYTVSYAEAESKDAGTYTVSVMPTGRTMKGAATAAYTIAKAALTVTADDKTMEKGSALPELTVSYAGFVGGETAAVLTAAPKAATGATPRSEVGEYEITVGGGEARNYELAYVSGTLTVTASQIETQDGQRIEAEVNVDGEGGKTAVITELSDDMLSGTAGIPTTVTTAAGEEIPVVAVEAGAFDGLRPGIIIELPEGIVSTAPVTNVINGDGTVTTLDLTGVEHFSLRREVSADVVILRMPVEQERFSVCLPYALTLPDGVTAYELSGGAGGKAVFTLIEGRELKAFLPYVLDVDLSAASGARLTRSGEAVVDLGTLNVTIDPDRDGDVVRKDEVEFVGAVHGLTNAEGVELSAYVMQPDFSWKLTASDDGEDARRMYLRPFRAYLRPAGGAGAAAVIESSFDDAPVGIRDLRSDAADDSRSRWYDLKGRRLAGQPTVKGIYVKDGRKVVVN